MNQEPAVHSTTLRPAVCVILALTLATALANVAYALSPEADGQITQDEQPLRVVTKEIEPFVIKDGDRLTGFSIDLWNEIALLTGLAFEYIEVESVGEQLEAVEQGQADVGIAAISITAKREEALDFSHPYYNSGLQVMTATSAKTRLLTVLANVLSSRLLPVLGVMALFIVIAGHLVWLFERGDNPDFPREYLPGVWAGIWWASVSVTTVGYGDLKVRRVLGRMLGIVWMFFGLVLIAGFTATVTAELTVAQFTSTIQDADDLRGHRVATVEGTTSAEYLANQRIPYVGVEDIESAYAMLYGGAIDAIVYDAPVLAHYASTTDEYRFFLVGAPIKEENYGIALPPESPHEELINQALLELMENGTYDELQRTWFGIEK